MQPPQDSDRTEAERWQLLLHCALSLVHCQLEGAHMAAAIDQLAESRLKELCAAQIEGKAGSLLDLTQLMKTVESNQQQGAAHYENLLSDWPHFSSSIAVDGILGQDSIVGGGVHCMVSLLVGLLLEALLSALKCAWLLYRWLRRLARNIDDTAVKARLERAASVVWRAARTGISSLRGGSNVVGIAFSGGGVRAAASALGVLQCLSSDVGGAPLKHLGRKLPSLEQVDFVSSVSGGGYTAIGWISHMCLGGAAEGSKEHQLDSSVQVFGKHAADQQPYATREFLLAGLVGTLRSVMYHWTFGIGLLYVTFFQLMIMNRTMGFGENKDVFEILAGGCQMLGIMLFCSLGRRYPESFCDWKRPWFAITVFVLSAAVIVLVNIGAQLLVENSGGDNITGRSLQSLMLVVHTVILLIFFMAGQFRYDRHAKVPLENACGAKAMFHSGLSAASMLFELHLYLAIPYFMYRLNPYFDFDVELQFSHRKIWYHVLLLLLALVWSIYDITKSRAMSSSKRYREQEGGRIEFSFIHLGFATIQRYLFLCIMMLFMQFASPVFKDFQCEQEQDTTQYYCQWPPCNLQDSAIEDQNYDDDGFSRNVVNKCNQDLLAQTAQNGSNWLGNDVSVCNQTIRRSCYRCKNWSTIPENFGYWADYFVPTMLFFMGYMLVLMTQDLDRNLSSFGWLQKDFLQKAFMPDSSFEPIDQDCRSQVGRVVEVCFTCGVLQSMTGHVTKGPSKKMTDLQSEIMKSAICVNLSEGLCAPPVLVVNSTLHNFMTSGMGEKSDQRSFHLFEATPFHWGSRPIGFRVQKQFESTDKSAVPMPGLADWMAISGAATSSSLGGFRSGSWRAEIFQQMISMLGLETGRLVHLLGPSSKRLLEYFGQTIVFLMLVIAMSQLIYLKMECDEGELDNTMHDGFVGRYRCLNHAFPVMSAFLLWAMLFAMVFGALLGPLHLYGHKVYRYLSSYSVIAHYMRSSEHVTLVAHKKPDQVFLADGGHFDNTAILPLLRRKCSTIVYVDCEANRDVHTMLNTIKLALDDFGLTFLATSATGEVLPVERALQDFYKPRCVIDLILLARLKSVKHSRSSIDQEWAEIANFCENAYSQLSPVLDYLPGCTHMVQYKHRKDLIYLYFDDKQMLEDALEQISQTHIQLPFFTEALRRAPCCTFSSCSFTIHSDDVMKFFRKVLEASSAQEQQWELTARFQKMNKARGATKLSSEAMRQLAPAELCIQWDQSLVATYLTEEAACNGSKFIEQWHATEQRNGRLEIARPTTMCVLVTPEARTTHQCSGECAPPGAEWGQAAGLESPSVFGANCGHFMSELNMLAAEFSQDITKVSIATVWTTLTDDACPHKVPHGKKLPVAKVWIECARFEDIRNRLSRDRLKAPALTHLRMQRGIAMEDTYRDVLNLKLNYHDGQSENGNLYVVKGELSAAEAADIDATGKQQPRGSCSPGHPLGTFQTT